MPLGKKSGIITALRRELLYWLKCDVEHLGAHQCLLKMKKITRIGCPKNCLRYWNIYGAYMEGIRFFVAMCILIHSLESRTQLWKKYGAMPEEVPSLHPRIVFILLVKGRGMWHVAVCLRRATICVFRRVREGCPHEHVFEYGRVRRRAVDQWGAWYEFDIPQLFSSIGHRWTAVSSCSEPRAHFSCGPYKEIVVPAPSKQHTKRWCIKQQYLV